MEVSLDTCGQRTVRTLLLLYLFVVKAAADCPKPQGRKNIVLSNESLLKNNFPEGSVVTLECTTGYVPESGSGVINCVDGNWTEPDLTCKKKDCGLPKAKPHMSFNTSSSTLFGDVIKVICDKGFQVSGSSYKQCYDSGWIGNSKCEIATCETPGKLTNGRSSWDSQDEPKYGEIIQYVCNDGFTLMGKNFLLCNENGEYDSPPPTCKGTTTEEITQMATPPAQDSSATPTPHRDKTVPTSATPTVSPSEQGGRNILTTEGKATASVTSMTSSSFQDKPDGAVDTNKEIGYMPVIVSVTCVSVAVCILALFLHSFLLKRKGSYDTREDLKPELLQFQNL